MLNSPEVRVIGLTTIPMSKVIVDPAQASVIACRKLPAPASRLLTTTGSFVQKAAAGESSEVKLLRVPTTVTAISAASRKRPRRERKKGGFDCFMLLGGSLDQTVVVISKGVREIAQITTKPRFTSRPRSPHRGNIHFH